jgi:hypothetical protein
MLLEGLRHHPRVATNSTGSGCGCLVYWGSAAKSVAIARHHIYPYAIYKWSEVHVHYSSCLLQALATNGKRKKWLLIVIFSFYH